MGGGGGGVCAGGGGICVGCWAAASGASGPVASTASASTTVRMRAAIFIGILLPNASGSYCPPPGGTPRQQFRQTSIIANGRAARKLDKRYNRRHIHSQEARYP